MLSPQCLLRVGAWSLSVFSERSFDGALISFLQKGNVFAHQPQHQVDASLKILRVENDDDRLQGRPWRLLEPAARQLNLLLGHSVTRCAHLLMGAMDWALHQILSAHRLLVLHASAVDFQGETSLFLGPRGSGKSTLALHLGLAGATVLADDRVALRSQPQSLWVSGCNTSAKVTGKTEEFYFPEGLAAKARDYQGLVKKEFALQHYVSTRPYQAFRPDKLYFLRNSSGFHLKPAAKSQALLWLIEQSRPVWKYASHHEMRQLHEDLARLVEETAAYELELGPNLRELNRLLGETNHA